MHSLYSRFFLLFSFLLLGACAETQLAAHVAKNMPGPGGTSEGNFKVGKPYTVEGKVYRPQETYEYTETGIASWYGAEFQGRKTANGERFDKEELTGAHRTLQMPSLVRVTNLDNGRSLVVRINDRGPFKRGRVIDLSQKAADLLGFKNKGTAKVKLQLMAEESRALGLAARRGEDTRGVEVAMNEKPGQPEVEQVVVTQQPPSLYQPISAGGQIYAPSAMPVQGHMKDGVFMPDPLVRQGPVMPTSIYVQAGSFAQQDNAVRLAASLQGFGNARVYPAIVNGQQFFRVRIGPVQNVEDADILLGRVLNAGQPQAIITVE